MLYTSGCYKVVMLTIRMQNIKSAPFCPIFETPTAEAQQQANSSRALLAIFEKVDSKYCQRLNILVGCVCAIHNDKITLLLPKSESVGVWYCARLILCITPPNPPGLHLNCLSGQNILLARFCSRPKFTLRKYS